MVSAAVTPDGYKVDSSGAWVPDMLNGYPMKISFHTLPFTFTEEGNEYHTQHTETIDTIVRELGSFYDDGTSQSISWLPPVLWANGSSYWIEGNTGIINGTIYKDWYQSNADSGIYKELPEGSVTGLEINKENGAIASFILQNDLGTYQIDCSDSITIDGTGAGWAVLFHDFRVRGLYDSVINGIYDAKIILITHSTKE